MTTCHVLLPIGSLLAFDTPECRTNWMITATVSTPDAHALEHSPAATSCEHCTWCGRLARTTPDCPLHAGACPRVSAAGTWHARIARHELLDCCPWLDALPVRAAALLDRSADTLAAAGRLHHERLTQLVFDQRVDWLPVLGR